jgi:hypothetical protein
MKLTDFKLLKKLMTMTTSSADQEALTALRRANEILARSATTWDRVLDRVVSLEVESAEGLESSAGTFREHREAQRRHARIDEQLTRAESATCGRSADFIASLRSQFEVRGDLSERQVEALEDVLDRERGRR